MKALSPSYHQVKFCEIRSYPANLRLYRHFRGGKGHQNYLADEEKFVGYKCTVIGNFYHVKVQKCLNRGTLHRPRGWTPLRTAVPNSYPRTTKYKYTERLYKCQKASVLCGTSLFHIFWSEGRLGSGYWHPHISLLCKNIANDSPALFSPCGYNIPAERCWIYVKSLGLLGKIE